MSGSRGREEARAEGLRTVLKGGWRDVDEVATKDEVGVWRRGGAEGLDRDVGGEPDVDDKVGQVERGASRGEGRAALGEGIEGMKGGAARK